MSEAAAFDPHRRALTGLAYRMLGSVSDAEDVVQDAFPPLVRGTARGCSGTARLPYARGDAAVPGCVEIRPGAARNLCWALAARAGARRSRGAARQRQ
ncbi:MAG: sigma factor [Rhodospirillales bacterium]